MRCALVVLGAMMPGPSPDELYADRTNLASARAAADAWAAELAQRPSAFEAAWKLARADYWLGGHAPTSERRAFLTRGIEAGRQAIAAAPNQPEGHFWTAANMGALAEASGIRGGLKYRRPIKDELEWVLRARSRVPAGLGRSCPGPLVFQGTGALWRQQGAWRKRICAPSLKYNPHSTASHFFLAELLLDRRARRRRPGRAAAGARRPARSRVDARRSGVQGQSPGTARQNRRETRMNVLLLSMPDSFEHMPPVAIRMPNGALASLAGNVDPHHRVAIADLILARREVRGTVERLVRELQPDVLGLSVMTFQRGTALNDREVRADASP